MTEQEFLTQYSTARVYFHEMRGLRVLYQNEELNIYCSGKVDYRDNIRYQETIQSLFDLEDFHVGPLKSNQELIYPEMILVEGGTFLMGSEEGWEDERPVHPVTLDPFEIGKYPVTQKQWEAVMGENPRHFKDCPDNPVKNVSWNDVQGFLEKLNAKTGLQYRLPTEAEWEFAARGGNRSQGYKYSGSGNLDEVAWIYNNSNGTTHPVGQKKPNELDLYDMSGNVSEWCQDWYGEYPASPEINPTRAYRVIRGGSWDSYPQDCRVTVRSVVAPSDSGDDVGFRLARSL